MIIIPGKKIEFGKQIDLKDLMKDNQKSECDERKYKQWLKRDHGQMKS